MTRDLTTGKPYSILWRYSLPMLLSMGLQQLYSIVDSMIVGSFVGDDALAAVGASYPVTVLFIAIANGMCVGCSVIASQLFGAKEYGKVRTSARTSLISMTLLGALLLVLGLLLCGPLMQAMNTQSSIFDAAMLYLNIYVGGLLFLFLYNTATALFTAMGDSLTPLIFLIVSVALNAGLDLWFVIGFGWGIAGAAWATFAAQGLQCVLALVVLRCRLKKLPDDGEKSRFDGRMLRRILAIGVPSVCQQSFISLGQILVQGVVNTFPIEVGAGYASAFKVNIFSVCCINTMSAGLSGYVGQTVGAGKWSRIRDGKRAMLWMTLVLSAVFAAAAVLFAEPIMRCFSSGEQVVSTGVQFLRIVSPFYLILTFKIINDGVFRGTGSMPAFLAGTFTDLFLRVVSAYLFAAWLGYEGMWWSFPLGWTVATVVSVLIYRFGRWHYADRIR